MMKKYILFTTILLTATICFGQQKEKTLIVDGNDINTIKAEYIEIVGYTTFLYGKKWAITFDLGEEYFAQKGHVYKNELGEEVDFKSPMHAVNYLVDCGWEFVDQTGGSADNSTGLFIVMYKKKKDLNQ